MDNQKSALLKVRDSSFVQLVVMCVLVFSICDLLQHSTSNEFPNIYHLLTEIGVYLLTGITKIYILIFYTEASHFHRRSQIEYWCPRSWKKRWCALRSANCLVNQDLGQRERVSPLPHPIQWRVKHWTLPSDPAPFDFSTERSMITKCPVTGSYGTSRGQESWASHMKYLRTKNNKCVDT